MFPSATDKSGSKKVICWYLLCRLAPYRKKEGKKKPPRTRKNPFSFLSSLISILAASLLLVALVQNQRTKEWKCLSQAKKKERINTKGVNQRSKDVTQIQQQRAESPTVTLTWHASKYRVHKLHILRSSDVLLVKFIQLVFTRMPGESYLRHLWWSLCSLYLLACHVRVNVGNSGLCCCVCVTCFQRWLTPLCVDSFFFFFIFSSFFPLEKGVFTENLRMFCIVK